MLEEPIEFFLKNHNLEEIKKKKKQRSRGCTKEINSHH